MPRSEWKYKGSIMEEKASNMPDLDRHTITKLPQTNLNNNKSLPVDQGGSLVVKNNGDDQQTPGV